MQHLRPADYRVMPWKNGGGSTAEIAIWPQDAVFEEAAFLWRLSLAEVIRDGPFSRLPGYDRHIMVVAGDGMRLVCAGHEDIMLAADSGPQRFSGDWEVNGMLKGGPVRDFNLMVRRAAAASSMRVQEVSGRTRLDAGDGFLAAYMLDGELTGGGHLAGVGDTLILAPGESLAVSALEGSTQVAICEIIPRAGAWPA
jgi:hypothetical protein